MNYQIIRIRDNKKSSLLPIIYYNKEDALEMAENFQNNKRNTKYIVLNSKNINYYKNLRKIERDKFLIEEIIMGLKENKRLSNLTA